MFSLSVFWPFVRHNGYSNSYGQDFHENLKIFNLGKYTIGQIAIIDCEQMQCACLFQSKKQFKQIKVLQMYIFMQFSMSSNAFLCL